VRDKLQPVEDSDLSENPANPITSGCRIKSGMTVLGLFTRLSNFFYLTVTEKDGEYPTK
jgi:hypothetical protein